MKSAAIAFLLVVSSAASAAERIDEGRVTNGTFVVTRRLNGDETHQGRHLRLPMGTLGIQRVKLYRFK
jgi:hypothetical protein